MNKALRALGRLPPENFSPEEGSVLTVSPREEGLQAKDIPLDALFKKVVSMRDKVRVLEQRVNSSDLSSIEKMKIENDITQVYQALSTLGAFFSADAFGPLGESEPSS